MDESQADVIVSLLQDLIVEIKGIRSEFSEFTGFNAVTLQDVSLEICTAVDVCAQNIEAIQGPLRYTLEDLNSRLEDVVSGLSSVESAVDLK